MWRLGPLHILQTCGCHAESFCWGRMQLTSSGCVYICTHWRAKTCVRDSEFAEQCADGCAGIAVIARRRVQHKPVLLQAAVLTGMVGWRCVLVHMTAALKVHPRWHLLWVILLWQAQQGVGMQI